VNELATLHRPRDPAGRAPAVRELHQLGLKPRDIAQAIRAPLPEVLEALRRESQNAQGRATR